MRSTNDTADSNAGQALVEAVLILPLLIALAMNVANFAYVILVALNVTTAPRAAVAYSVMGYSTPGTSAAGSPSTVPDATPFASNTPSLTASNLAYEDLQGGVSGYAGVKVQICSTNAGTTNTGSAKISLCRTCTSYSMTNCTSSGNTYTPTADPEVGNIPSYVLHRVDVTYSFNTLFRGRLFNASVAPLCPGGACTFHRQLSMRSMN